MAKKEDDAVADAVGVVVPFFYGDASPGDTVPVDAEEAARLVGLGAAYAKPAESKEG